MVSEQRLNSGKGSLAEERVLQLWADLSVTAVWFVQFATVLTYGHAGTDFGEQVVIYPVLRQSQTTVLICTQSMHGFVS